MNIILLLEMIFTLNISWTLFIIKWFSIFEQINFLYKVKKTNTWKLVKLWLFSNLDFV